MFVQADCNTLFGHPIYEEPIDIFTNPSPFTPEKNEDYVFNLETLRLVLNWIMNGSRFKQGFYLFGPSGAGKTSVVEQVCARMNLALYYECATDGMEMSDLIGNFQLVQGGEMRFIDGQLTQAYRTGGIFLLDEMDRWNVPSKMYSILEGKPLYLPTGECIRCHPNFRLFATGNTSGSGDVTGKYRDTYSQNEAFLQRFDCLRVTYPEAKVEEKILFKFLQSERIPDEIAAEYALKMVKTANLIRGNTTEQGNLGGNEIEIDFGTRTLLSWAENMVAFRGIPTIAPVEFGLERAVLCRASQETAEAVLEIVRSIFSKL